MKFKMKVILAELGEDYVAVPVGGQDNNFMVRLNATGAAVWRGLEAGKSMEEIAKKLTEEYDVDLPHAEKAVASVVEQLKDADILVE